MKALLTLKSFSIVLGLFVVVSPLSGATWWVTSSSDAQWTNKTVAELTSATQATNALAQFYYARACFYGSGRPRDVQEAFLWLKRAAEQGLPDAQYMLARFYLSGTATSVDSQLGVQWAEQAAVKNHAEALAILGDAYGSGYGVAVDVKKARVYFQRAIEAGSIWALDWFGHFLMNGEARTASKTNHAAALQLFERAASNGMTHATSHLVDFYLKGLGSPPNVPRAIYWARQAVDQDDVEMMEKLAGFYSQGVAEPRDASETTLELFRRAAGGRASSFEKIGAQRHALRDLYALRRDASEVCKRYRFGLGTPRDYISFAQWLLVLKRADAWEAELDPRRRDPKAQGVSVFDRIVTGQMPVTAPEDQRIREAVTTVRRALEVGDAVACRDVGEMYRHGSPLTPESPQLAWLWLNRAAELKDGVAIPALREVEGTLSEEHLSRVRQRYLPKPGRQP